MKITNILRSVAGDFEITRVLGSIGVAVYIVAANGFTAWTVFVQDKPFDVVAYCAAFPTGLGVAIAAIVTAAAHKDKTLAVAQTVRETGAMPAESKP